MALSSNLVTIGVQQNDCDFVLKESYRSTVKVCREDSYYKRPFLSISKVPNTRRVTTHTGHWPEIAPFCALMRSISQHFC